MSKKKLMYFTFLIIIFNKVVCQKFLVSRRNSDNLTYCVTDSECALSWINEDIDISQHMSQYFPKQELKYFNLITSGKSNIWSLKKSKWDINRIILDLRWEGMELVTTVPGENDHKMISSKLSNNFVIPFSIRSAEASMFFCDGSSPQSSNCYVFSWNNNKIVIEKCKKNEISRLLEPCSFTLNETKPSSSISIDYWSHFQVLKIENQLSLSSFDGKTHKTILQAIDTENSFSASHLIISSKKHKSYWKIHDVEYFYTEQDASNIHLTNKLITSPNGTICVSLFVSMCDSCQLKLTLTKHKHKSAEKNYKPEINRPWLYVKFLVKNLSKGNYTVLLSTIGNAPKKFWAVDEPQECQTDFRGLKSNSETNCQLMCGEKNVISLQNAILTEPVNCDFGEICDSYWSLYKNWSSGIQFCSTYSGKQPSCSCAQGFTIESRCQERCPEGFYGFNCKNQCDCGEKSDCHYISGMCKECPEGYTGIKCKIPINPKLDFSMYEKNSNSISLRWKPAMTIFEQRYSFEPNQHQIVFFHPNNNLRYLVGIYKYHENGLHCELWPEFLCWNLTSLINDTEFTVQLKAYYHVDITDFTRTDAGLVGTIKTRTVVGELAQTENFYQHGCAVLMSPKPSEPPYDLKTFWDEENILTLEWKHPNQSNGHIDYFKIQFSISKNRTFIVNVARYNLTYYYRVGHYIPPATEYFIEISAYNGFEGKKLIKQDISPPDVPSLVEKPRITTYKDLIKVTIIPKLPQRWSRTLYKLFVYISSDDFIAKEDEFGLKNARLVVECTVTLFERNYTFFIGNGTQQQLKNCNQRLENFKLNFGTAYNVTIVLRNSLKEQHRNKIYSFISVTETSTKIFLYCVILGALFLVILIIVVVIVLKKRRRNVENDLFKDILMKKLSKNKKKLVPYENVCSKSITPKRFNNYVIKCDENKEFERQHEVVVETFYENMYEDVKSGEYFDYINMVYTRRKTISKAYIATELLTENNQTDFWKIVWHDNVRYIVLQENFNKDDKTYWLENKEKINCKGISVQLDFSKAFQNFYYRKFTLSYKNKVRHVNQMHLTYNGIDPSKYVPFFRKTLQFPLSSRSPILMHSSHGIDRLGLILLCDMSLRMAKDEDVIDVWMNLKELAKCRIELAGNVLQYRFAHLIILKCLSDEKCSEELEDGYINL